MVVRSCLKLSQLLYKIYQATTVHGKASYSCMLYIDLQSPHSAGNNIVSAGQFVLACSVKGSCAEDCVQQRRIG